MVVSKELGTCFIVYNDFLLFRDSSGIEEALLAQLKLSRSLFKKFM